MTKDEVRLGMDFIEAVSQDVGIDSSRVKRIVIDVTYGAVVTVYVEHVGSKKLLAIDWPGKLRKAEVKWTETS